MSRGFRGCHRIATTSRKRMATKRYSMFSVNDNPEPVDWQKSMRSIAPGRIHKRWCNATISSRYQGIKFSKVEQDRIRTGSLTCRRQVLQVVCEMESKENIMVRTMIARDPILGARRIYTKGIIIVTMSFHDKFYIVSMGMNTKVQGRLPLLQCITFQFTSWFR